MTVTITPELISAVAGAITLIIVTIRNGRASADNHATTQDQLSELTTAVAAVVALVQHKPAVTVTPVVAVQAPPTPPQTS